MSFSTSAQILLEKIFKKRKQSSAFEELSARLEKHRLEALSEFEEKHRGTLRWLHSRGVNPEEILERGTRGALASVAAGMMLLSNGLGDASVTAPQITQEVSVNKITDEASAKKIVDKDLSTTLAKLLPSTNRPLTKEEEKKILKTIKKITGIKVAAELNGNRLNTNYGRIGLEQHLPRYAGETISEHFENDISAVNYAKSGMTRNRGAFGYFGANRETLTPQEIDEEKYYAVVQTFLSPGWGTKKGIVDWYKHRKVLIINPVNGKAVIGSIADSGPAKFTGKNFGGSPELMDSMDIYFGNYKHPVLLFFIDNSEKGVKLGPL